jgi:hypothetical protein
VLGKSRSRSQFERGGRANRRENLQRRPSRGRRGLELARVPLSEVDCHPYGQAVSGLPEARGPRVQNPVAPAGPIQRQSARR